MIASLGRITKPPAAYLRLSIATDDSVSIAGQTRLVNDECEKRGWPAPILFTDDGISGSKVVKRPGRDELERRMGKGEFGALIVKSVDRLARSTVDFHRIAETARKVGCALVVTDLGLDTSTPIGEMVLGVLAQIAAFEVRMTGARMQTSNEERMSVGRAIGGPVPYGFRNISYSDKPGTYRVIDEDEAHIVKRIATDLLDGHSLMSIAQALHLEGVPTPRDADATRNGRKQAETPAAWNYSTVRRVVKNPAVAGMVLFRGDLVRDKATGLPQVDPETAILSSSTYRRVLDTLRARSDGKKTRTVSANRLLLDGIAVCSGCGHPMRKSSSGGGKYVNYACSLADLNRCEVRATIGAKILEEFVVAEFLAVYGDFPVTEAVETADPEKVARLGAVRAEVATTTAKIPTAAPSDIPALADLLVSLRQTEEAMVRDLEASPGVELVQTGRTFSETWEDSCGDVVARRDLLASVFGSIVVSRAQPKGSIGRVPLSQRVTLMGHEEPSV